MFHSITYSVCSYDTTPDALQSTSPEEEATQVAAMVIMAKWRQVGGKQLEKIGVLKEMIEDLEREREFEEGLERLVRG